LKWFFYIFKNYNFINNMVFKILIINKFPSFFFILDVYVILIFYFDKRFNSCEFWDLFISLFEFKYLSCFFIYWAFSKFIFSHKKNIFLEKINGWEFFWFFYYSISVFTSSLNMFQSLNSLFKRLFSSSLKCNDHRGYCRNI
jgi:hypothetical protein